MKIRRFLMVLTLSLPIFSSAAAAEPASTSASPQALLLAEIAYQNGEYSEAAKYYLEFAEETEDVEAAENAARAAARANDKDLLRESGRYWSKLAPDDLGAAEFLARVYSDIGDLDEAVVQLDRVRRSYLGGADQGFDSVVPYLQRERNRRTAVTLMEKLVKGHEKTPAAVYGLAYMQARARFLDEALITIEQALDLEPSSPRSIRFKADILLALKRDDEALSYLKRSLDKYDEHSLRVHYARALRFEGDIDESIRQYQIVVDNRSEDEEDYISLGALLYEQARYKEAMVVYHQLTQISPELPQAWFYLGEISEQQGLNKAAIDWYAKVPESQFYIEAGKKRAALLAQDGDTDAAREQIQVLRELNYVGVGSELTVLEGEILQSAGQSKVAAEVYEQALKEMPGDPEILFARALLAKDQGDFAFFETEVKQLLADDPEYEDCLLALGFALADRTRYHEARQYLEPLSKLRPDDERVAGYYGEVLWHEGDKAAAQEVWAQGLLVNPHSEMLHSVTERYQTKPAQ